MSKRPEDPEQGEPSAGAPVSFTRDSGKERDFHSTASSQAPGTRRDRAVIETLPDRVVIFDTTLRDGEQSPGASMNLGQKLQVAGALRDLGVDVIEAGFAAASPGDLEAIQGVARQVEGPINASGRKIQDTRKSYEH